MSTISPNPSRAIQVIPSEHCNIPNPALYITNTIVIDSSDGYIVVDLDLKTLGINIGDILYDYDSGYADVISQIHYSGHPNQYTIYYSNQVGGVSIKTGDTVQIYNGEDDSVGCLLYCTAAGDADVVTAGGDAVLFTNIPLGLLPVQVKKLSSTGGGSTFIALR